MTKKGDYKLDKRLETMIVKRYCAGEPIIRLSKAFHISGSTLHNILKRRNVHIRDRGEAATIRDHTNDVNPEYVPSPEEIAKLTAVFRKSHIRKRLSETHDNYDQSVSGIRCCKVFETTNKQL